MGGQSHSLNSRFTISTASRIRQLIRSGPQLYRTAFRHATPDAASRGVFARQINVAERTLGLAASHVEPRLMAANELQLAQLGHQLVADDFPHQSASMCRDAMFLPDRAAALEVRNQPLAQRGRHADIDQLPRTIDGAIDAGRSRALGPHRAAHHGKVLRHRNRLQRRIERQESRRAESRKPRASRRTGPIVFHRLILLVQRRWTLVYSAAEVQVEIASTQNQRDVRCEIFQQVIEPLRHEEHEEKAKSSEQEVAEKTENQIADFGFSATSASSCLDFFFVSFVPLWFIRIFEFGSLLWHLVCLGRLGGAIVHVEN